MYMHKPQFPLISLNRPPLALGINQKLFPMCENQDIEIRSRKLPTFPNLLNSGPC